MTEAISASVNRVSSFQEIEYEFLIDCTSLAALKADLREYLKDAREAWEGSQLVRCEERRTDYLKLFCEELNVWLNSEQTGLDPDDAFEEWMQVIDDLRKMPEAYVADLLLPIAQK